RGSNPMIRRCIPLPPSLALLVLVVALVLPALSQGEPNFRYASRDYFVGLQPTAVGVGDFDGDGVSDLAVANTGDFPGTVSILLGNGDGTFRPGQKFAAGSSPASIQIADFNNDGILDIAVVNFNSDHVTILFGRGDGAFGPPQTVLVGSAAGALVV